MGSINFFIINYLITTHQIGAELLLRALLKSVDFLKSISDTQLYQR